MPTQPYLLAGTHYGTVLEAGYRVAVLPWGATEAHNYHLPYATDTIQCDHIAAEAARIAWEKGARVVVLPTVPFGVQTGQLDIPLDLNLNPSTQLAVLRDLAWSLDAHGIEKLVILNGHGGNDFRQMIRELQPELDLLLCTVNWYTVVDPADYFDESGDHAGEVETSLMMHLSPDTVRPLSEAGPGAERPFSVAAFREGWAWTPRQWSRITDDTGVGDPTAATPEKGARYFAAVTRKIAGFLVELAATDQADLYQRLPHPSDSASE